MPATDANDATWYVLRYVEDFIAPTGVPVDPTAPFGVPSAPYLQPTLLFDERRGVLELQPEASPVAADPPPGIALDVDGEIYRVDDSGTLVVIRCDGTCVPLLCEPNVLAQPAGLALDRRGFLYIADPAARRVVVLLPDAGTVQAILGGGGPVGALVEPIDVATSPSGCVYVADRAGGRIAVFSAGMKPLAAFATATAEGQAPQPIAVMVDADGNLLVADAYLPRLLCYAPDGTRLADRELSTLTAPLAGGDLANGALNRAYGDHLPRFLVGSCGPCATPADDGGARLAEVHRALRLLALTLGRRFEQLGVFISRSLDSGRPGVPWHRIEVELNGAPPPGARVLAETFTSDEASPPIPNWIAPRDTTGAALPFTTDVPEQLVQSPRGRYLWVRATLESDAGTGTPSVRAIRAYYPRVSWLDLLPTAYRRDPDAATFMDHFLALFEHVFTGVEDRYVEFSRQLDPSAAPQDVINWLAALVDLAFDPSWPIERRRALVGEAMSLYRTRGTIAGIERYVEIYIGVRPAIVERWLERPVQPTFLGRPGSVLGCGLPLLGSGPSPAMLPDDELWARYAHRFTIYVYIDDRCDTEVTLRAVDTIVEVNKPAHTVHTLQAIYPDARVGLQSRIGLDFVLGAATAPRTELGDGGSDPSTSGGGNGSGSSGVGGVLGVDTVLGARRPEYVRRLDGEP
jgi:phage tail-like protein